MDPERAQVGSVTKEEHTELFAIIWEEVKWKFKPSFVLGERGLAFVQTWAIKALHPLFA